MKAKKSPSLVQKIKGKEPFEIRSVDASPEKEITELARRIVAFGTAEDTRRRVREFYPGAGCPIELDTLGVGFERNVRDPGAIGQIDHGQCAVSISDKDPVPEMVHADIVGVRAQLEPPDFLEVLRLEKPHRPVAAIRDIERVAPRHEGHALWLAEVADDVDHPLRIEVNDPHRVVAELSDKQAMARRIDCHVIDPATYIPQWDFGFKLED